MSKKRIEYEDVAFQALVDMLDAAQQEGMLYQVVEEYGNLRSEGLYQMEAINETVALYGLKENT